MYLKFNHIHFKTGNSQKALLPPSNEVCEGYVFTRICHSVHGGGGGYPSMPCKVVSQHALQVSGGVSRPTPGGEGSPGPHRAGCITACTEADPPRGRLLPRAVRILLESILVFILFFHTDCSSYGTNVSADERSGGRNTE